LQAAWVQGMMVMAEKTETKSKRKAPRKRATKKAEAPEAKKEEPKVKEAPKAEAPKKEEPKPEAKKEAPKEEKKEAPKKPRRAPKKKKKGVRTEHARGKRKKSIARATVKEGSGRIRVNSRLVSSFGNRYFREIVAEPLALLGPDGLNVDVAVKVRGGGEMGQAQACRTAIARALAQYFGEGVVAKYKADDTYLLREDPRRVEPKKYMGPKARARDQKSYR
jgi:small subunit ribosomal protein S9